jgi:hypothetical protein
MRSLTASLLAVALALAFAAPASAGCMGHTTTVQSQTPAPVADAADAATPMTPVPPPTETKTGG